MPVHHTPLRRISQGSLHQSANAGQRASSPSPTGLDFLPIHDLVDEIETLNQNLEVMERLTSSLAKFNEGFAMFSYGLRMSAFSVEWSEAPDETTWERVALEEERERQHQAELEARAATQARLNPHPLPDSPDRYGGGANNADTTYHTQYSSTAEEDQERAQVVNPRGSARGRGIARGRGRGGAGGIPVAQRRQREAQINSLIDTLPLEFRGSQPALRDAMAKVIGELMGHPSGRRMADLVTSDLPQIKVNRCLIALVGKKAVVKVNEGGVANYVLIALGGSEKR